MASVQFQSLIRRLLGASATEKMYNYNRKVTRMLEEGPEFLALREDCAWAFLAPCLIYSIAFWLNTLAKIAFLGDVLQFCGQAGRPCFPDAVLECLFLSLQWDKTHFNSFLR